MRRQEIVEGLHQVVAGLLDSKVLEAIDALMDRVRKSTAESTTQESFEVFKRYILAARHFNQAAKSVATIFDLDVLENPSFWAHTTKRDHPDSVSVGQIYRNVRYALEYLPKLAALIRQESVDFTESDTDIHELAGKRVLTLILPEESHQHSTPERIAKALLAITHLYEGLAFIESLPDDSLSVLACDSGSDKSFDLLGAAKLMTALKDLILSIWDRVFFFREQQVAQRLELVTASLPILEKLSELEKNQSVGPEQAEIMRRKILGGVSEFLSSGAIIPEMKPRTEVEPRELMAPEPKLLTTGEGQVQSKKAGKSRKHKRPSEES